MNPIDASPDIRFDRFGPAPHVIPTRQRSIGLPILSEGGPQYIHNTEEVDMTEAEMAKGGIIAGMDLEKLERNLSTTMGHSTGLIREQCPVW